jgi:hypothetical protein
LRLESPRIERPQRRFLRKNDPPKIGEESCHFSDDIAAPTSLLSKFHRSGQTETAGDDMRETLISKAWNAFSIVRETAGASASRAGTIESDRKIFSEKHD